MSILTAAAISATRAATNPAGAGDRGWPLLIELIMLCWLVLSFLVMVLAHVYRRRGILGPERLGDDQPLIPVWLLMFICVFTWLGVQTIYLSWRQEQWLHRIHAKTGTYPLTAFDYTFLSIVPQIIGFLVLLLGDYFSGPRLLEKLGLGFRAIARGLVIGMIGWIVALPLVVNTMEIFQWIYQRLNYEHPAEHELITALKQSDNRSISILLIVAAVVIVPFFEEFLFRGHLQSLVKKSLAKLDERPSPVGVGRPGRAWPAWGAVLISSFMFAAVHPHWEAPAIFVLALVIGYVYERTANLWACITIHCLFNGFMISLSAFGPQ